MKTTTQQKPISKMGYMEIEDSLILCLNSKVTKQNVLFALISWWQNQLETERSGS